MNHYTDNNLDLDTTCLIPSLHCQPFKSLWNKRKDRRPKTRSCDSEIVNVLNNSPSVLKTSLKPFCFYHEFAAPLLRAPWNLHTTKGASWYFLSSYKNQTKQIRRFETSRDFHGILPCQSSWDLGLTIDRFSVVMNEEATSCCGQRLLDNPTLSPLEWFVKIKMQGDGHLYKQKIQWIEVTIRVGKKKKNGRLTGLHQDFQHHGT